MRIGEPDLEPGDRTGSLAERLGGAWRDAAARLGRAPQGAPGSRRIAFGVAALLILGPVFTAGGAALLRDRARAEAQRLEAASAPRRAAEEAARGARFRLGAVVAAPTVGTTLDALARALPAEAMLALAERRADGILHVEIASPDPDRLRAALRGEPLLAPLRNVGQRQQAGAIVSTFEGRLP